MDGHGAPPSGWGEPTHQPAHTPIPSPTSPHPGSAGARQEIARGDPGASNARRTASGTATAFPAARVRVSSAVAADVGPKGEPPGSHTVPAAGTSPVNRYRVT